MSTEYVTCNNDCHFREFFTMSREAMFVTSREGIFLDVNNAMVELLGYSRDELVGSKVEMIYEKAEDRLGYVNMLEKNLVVHDYKIVMRKANGEAVLCLIEAIVRNRNDQIEGYFGIIRVYSDIMKSARDYYNELKEEHELVREERKSLFHDAALFMRYGSDELLDYVQHTGENPLKSGKKRVTVLFFDLVGSTAIAEKLEPDLFSSFLNELFIDIMDLIYGNHGSVNKMLGDGIMATFGAPLETGRDAFNAVNAAKQIQEYLVTYNDFRPDYMKEKVAAGIGIATGEVFAGVVGSVRREEYTVLGDTVNVAARLEKLTRQVGGSILIDEETFNEVKDEFPLHKKYKNKLRGREETAVIYSIG